MDLSPKHISNHDMGTIFEDLIHKFSETSNEEAWSISHYRCSRTND